MEPTETKPEKRRGDGPFEPGFYEHYKGGIYYACVVALSNELTEQRIGCVVYYSLEKGIYNMRPLDHPDYDSFLDEVCLKGFWTNRFRKLSGSDLLTMDVLKKYWHALPSVSPVPPATPNLDELLKDAQVDPHFLKRPER